MGQVQKVSRAESPGCLAKDNYRVGLPHQGDLVPRVTFLPSIWLVVGLEP